MASYHLTLQDAYLCIPAAPTPALLPQLPESAAGFSHAPNPPGGAKKHGENSEICEMGVKLLSPSLPGETDRFPITQLQRHLALGYRSN